MIQTHYNMQEIRKEYNKKTKKTFLNVHIEENFKISNLTLRFKNIYLNIIVCKIYVLYFIYHLSGKKDSFYSWLKIYVKLVE